MKDYNRRKREARLGRHRRVRGKIFGTSRRPRLSIFRSSKHIYAQIIDDEKGETLLGIGQPESTKELKKKIAKTEKAEDLGELLAKKAAEQGIKEVIFDRGGFQFHGRVKAFAEGARKGGLKF